MEHKEELRKLAKSDKVVAIGEVGLEYFSHTEEKVSEEMKQLQREGFSFQLELAKELHLPVIIHCRGARPELPSNFRETSEAYEDVLEMIKNYSELKFVFHGYGGRLDFTKKIVNETNIFFSFNGNITYAKPNAEILEVIKLIPLEKIMLETDCPYLTPVPHRGQRNEPAYVRYVAQKMAEIKGFSQETVEKMVDQNARHFFGL